MRKVVALIAVMSMVAGGVLALRAKADDDKPKHSIKDVMKTAHKGGLLKKVLSGSADDDDKALLNELYASLAKNKPPKGDLESWKEKTAAIVKAAKEGDTAALKKATNCGACHKAHKG